MKNKKTDILVIGSGPGGAVSALTTLEAGFDVLVLEEGDYYKNSSPPNHNIQEIKNYCRQGGLTFMFGSPKISYAEGRCVGGGSEVNGGLYHRTPKRILEKWNIKNATEKDMAPHFKWVEEQLSIVEPSVPNTKSSQKLLEGATALKWKSMLVPQWFSMDNSIAKKHSMTQTILKRFLEKNGTIESNIWVEKIEQTGPTWKVIYKQSNKTYAVEATQVILACGAIQTPALLKRSGLGQLLKPSLACHPMLKVMAEFPQSVQDPNQTIQIGNVQVKEFENKFTFGCGVSNESFISQSASLHPNMQAQIEDNWKSMSNYYVQIQGPSVGKITQLPFFKEPVLTYKLSKKEIDLIKEGLVALCQLLFKAGAKTIYPLVHRAIPISSASDIQKACNSLSKKQLILSTIHLFGSCPMASSPNKGVVDSHGNVFNLPNLHIHDASILCSAPGVNPQGSVMAFARRNSIEIKK
ncbi:GMC family oxidoreductase [Candidatus Marinamargulisbacteria bacterium SCGC AAA071-K20]|nr:GMC family oxidoreductase [Candidatus Marinamargulisbacteria bacterium SCGC AAA071-K20]